MSNNGDVRRLSGNLPLPYDRQQPGPPYPEHPLATPPAPPTAYPYYDRFAPEEPLAPPFREGVTPEYNPKFWRTDREYPPPIPSPERYRPPPAEPWPRPPTWQEPEPVPWPDRREPVRDPYTPPQWNRPGREAPATRMFEPSATWKQIHSGPPPYPDSVPPPRERPAERFGAPPVRDFRDRPVDRPRAREVFSPPQAAGERFPPFSPPAPPGSAARNRFPFVNPRSDNYRPPLPEPDWAPEDDDLYADRGEGSSRDPPPPFSARAKSQDLIDRRRMSRDNVERSVSPVPPRSAQHSSPGYGATAASVPKRESPELPHLVPLPHKPQTSEPVRIPLGPEPATSSLPPKPVSRSPSHSSTTSSSKPPYASFQLPQRGPPKVQQFQAPYGSFGTVNRPPVFSQAMSPVVQKSPAAQVSTGVDSSASAPRDQNPSSVKTVVTTPQAQPQSTTANSVGQSAQPSQAMNSWNKGRLSYIQRAPSFVPSTLAIDAKLKYPDLDATGNVGSQNAEAGASTSSIPDQQSAQTTADEGKGMSEMESDMEMSQPASPMKGLQDRDDIRIKETQEVRVTSDDAEDAADTSDMDMSPPASPVTKPVDVPAHTSLPITSSSPPPSGEKAEPLRPALSIDTSIASPQQSRTMSRKRPPPSSTASTPNPRGDESDMEMSSGASSSAPSPVVSPVIAAQSAPKPPPPRSSPAPSQENSSQVQIPALSLPAAVDPPRTPVPTRRDVAVSPLLQPRRSSVTTPQPISSISDKDALPRDTVEGREQAMLATPRGQRTAAYVERQNVASGELSPPISEETLREETEGAEKDPDTTMHVEKEPPAVAEKQAVPPVKQTTADPEKVITDIPLADALRMVVRLRMLFPHQTQAERVDPIIMSNRHIAEPEQPEQPQAEAVVEAVVEKEQEQVARGEYDGTKHSLRKRFAEHQAALADKVERLRKEYLELHEKWLVHCAKLDEIARASALEEAAATAGRTTRRSAAMGDAVRTDLEMEQILASLGNEELTDANHLSAKNAAVIPDMLSVTKGRVDPIFDDTNNLVEDPHSFYALETGIDDWTDEEKVIFVEKYVKHPKQFGIIADFLPNKTPAQCVTFYYLHKNTTIDFRKILAQFNTVGKRTRRGRGGKQKGNALLADILKHDDEVSRGATPNTASARRRRGQPPATPVGTTPVAETEAGPSSTPAAAEQQKKTTVSRRSTTQNTPAGTPTPDPPEPAQPATKRPRRRAVPTPKAVAAMGQDKQDDGDEAADEDPRPAKRTRKSRKSKAAESEVPPTPTPAPAEVSTPAPSTSAETKSAETKFIDQTEATARKKSGGGSGNWSEDDKALFMKLLAEHGNDFKRIAASMPNKTTIQVTSFYKANLSEMELAKVASAAPKSSSVPSRSAVGTPAVDPPPSATDVHSRSNTATSSSPNPPTISVSQSLAPPDTPGPAPTPVTDAIPARFRGPMTNGTSSGPSAAVARPVSAFPGFGASPLEPSAFVRLTAPPQPGGNGSPVVMEFSNFAPQPWMSGAHSLVGQGPLGNGSQTAGPPATLETTEDLMRYLEHRTRLTAGQSSDSDFL